YTDQSQTGGDTEGTTIRAQILEAPGLGDLIVIGAPETGSRLLDNRDLVSVLPGASLTALNLEAIRSIDDFRLNTSVFVDGLVQSLSSVGAGPAAIKLHGTSTGATTAVGNNQVEISETGVVRSSHGTGISLRGASSGVSNAGEISGNGFAIRIDGGINLIENSGLITGDVASYGFLNSVINLGSIAGSVFVYGTSGAVANAGLIRGNVSFGTGDDDNVFDGRGGQVLGEVRGGDGDDLYIMDTSTLRLLEEADYGTDTVEAAVSWELGENFEELTLLGGDDLNGEGNALSNRLRGNMGANRLDGGDETDYLFGRGGSDTILGGDGDDYISANSGWDIIRGEAGNDTILGGAGRDLIDGGEGQDRASYYNAQANGVFASLRNPENNRGIAYGDNFISVEDLWGSEFDDFLYGDDGNNEITGDRGDDVLWGWDGNDSINGMWDNDTIAGNKCDDTLRGGLGADVFQFWSGNGNDTIV
ncbi:hypothetical protein AB9K41_10120, partial [Cribrihabitans sp. XS_ASV171]